MLVDLTLCLLFCSTFQSIDPISIEAVKDGWKQLTSRRNYEKEAGSILFQKYVLLWWTTTMISLKTYHDFIYISNFFYFSHLIFDVVTVAFPKSLQEMPRRSSFVWLPIGHLP